MVHFHSCPSTAACLCGVNGFAGSLFTGMAEMPSPRSLWVADILIPAGWHSDVEVMNWSCCHMPSREYCWQLLPMLYKSGRSCLTLQDSCRLSKDSNDISSSFYPFSSVSRQQLFHNLRLYSWQLFLGNCKLQVSSYQNIHASCSMNCSSGSWCTHNRPCCFMN